MVKDSLSGRLAVILHADVVGSTRLVQRDEQRAHQRIQESFHRFRDTIETYHGYVRELRGDALLAEFERASDAVSAAFAFQSEQAEYNAQLEDEIRPQVRIGIALGEVVVADNTVTGAGVVLAQRLEQLAEPGGLNITPAIHEALPQRLPFTLENLGHHDLKGFDDPIDIYRVALRAGAAIPTPDSEPWTIEHETRRNFKVAVGAVVFAVIAIVVWGYIVWKPTAEKTDTVSAAMPASEMPSIAVLPFDNMSGDQEQEYFADGITEDLTTDLSKISGLFVVARNSAFIYKGRSVNVRTVAEELGVRYVLEGSVRRAANQIRINAQLIDALSGGHIWADRFDGTLADVFTLQDEVNRSIVTALKVSLTTAEKQRFDLVETRVPEAYDVLLQGLERYNEFNREAVVEARELFKHAAELDPNYARAYANIALTHANEVAFFWTRNREESIRKGLEFANRALQIDNSIPQIYLTRAILYLSQRQHAAALEAAKRTTEVHPGYADGHVSLAFVSSYSGEYELALEALQRARQINPQSTGVYLAIEGRVLFLMQRYAEALSVLEESVERNPGFDMAHLNLAALYTKLDRPDDAAWSVDEALAISPELSLSKILEEALYRDQADIDHFIGALRKAGVPE